MKPVDVKDNMFNDSKKLHSNKEVNDKDPKSKVGDHVRIFKYKNIFAKKINNKLVWRSFCN